MDFSDSLFEACQSSEQELTFAALKDEMNKRSIEFGAEQMKSFGLIRDDGTYSNLALLLSDQCKHVIDVSVFQGKDMFVFRGYKEFSGSVIKQLNDVYSYLDMMNKTKGIVSGLYRMDTKDYPEEAIKESLLNCIIHRDYSFTGRSIINVFKDHIEFINHGGLMPGLALDDIYLGISDSRNRNLASVFLRLGLVEGFGTGIGKIVDSYRGFYPAPLFQATGRVFKVTLYNENESHDGFFGDVVSEPKPQYGASIIPRETLSRSILSMAKEKGIITRKDVQDMFKVGSTKAFLCLKTLCEEGKLRQLGSGRQTYYTI